MFVDGQFAGTTCEVLEEDSDLILVEHPYFGRVGRFQKLKPNEVLACNNREEADRAWKIIKNASSIDEGLALWKKVRCLI